VPIRKKALSTGTDGIVVVVVVVAVADVMQGDYRKHARVYLPT
jgi:hypothetical protein